MYVRFFFFFLNNKIKRWMKIFQFQKKKNENIKIKVRKEDEDSRVFSFFFLITDLARFGFSRSTSTFHNGRSFMVSFKQQKKGRRNIFPDLDL